ncbi:MAG: FAD-binding oxidoreductase [Bacteriovoracaceae bacterium]
MPIIKKAPKSFEELSELIHSEKKILALSSQTGTVIPYEKIESFMGDDELSVIELGLLPKNMSLDQNHLTVSASVTWSEARAFLRSKNRELMCSPTEELACICAGAATSATGERSFGFGPFRDQIISLKYMDYNGVVHQLDGRRSLELEGLLEYQADFQKYDQFKNAPFPKLQNECDVMIGMEGQLGVITELVMDTVAYEPLSYFVLPVQRWEKDESELLEVFEKVQSWRDAITACELLDWNSIKNFKQRPFQDKDIICFEVKSSLLEKVVEGLFSNFELDNILELPEKSYHELRKGVPRAVAEYIAKNDLIKRGTDIQVRKEDFKGLLEQYKKATKIGIEYLLFGHFGDAHLHFNFLPTKEQMSDCEEFLNQLYEKMSHTPCSPFAEHGIGIIKQKFIRPYIGKNQLSMFKKLKQVYDPHNKFFPYGLLQLGNEL